MEVLDHEQNTSFVQKHLFSEPQTPPHLLLFPINGVFWGSEHALDTYGGASSRVDLQCSRSEKPGMGLRNTAAKFHEDTMHTYENNP